MEEALLAGTATIASCYTRSGRCRHETLHIPAKGSRVVPGRLILQYPQSGLEKGTKPLSPSCLHVGSSIYE